MRDSRSGGLRVPASANRFASWVQQRLGFNATEEELERKRLVRQAKELEKQKRRELKQKQRKLTSNGEPGNDTIKSSSAPNLSKLYPTLANDLQRLYTFVHPVELSTEYDVAMASEYFRTRPIAVLGRSLQISTMLGVLAFQLVVDSLALKAGTRYSKSLARWAQKREAREVKKTVVELGKYSHHASITSEVTVSEDRAGGCRL